MLQLTFLDFQRLTATLGKSTRHGVRHAWEEYVTELDNYHASMEHNYIAIGRLMDAWDRVEGSWANFFELLLPIRLAQRVFFSASSFSGKLKMIERCLEVSETLPERETIASTLKRSEKLSNRRNDIVHGVWIGTKPGQAIRVAIRKDYDDAAAVCRAYMDKSDQKLMDRAYNATRMLGLADDMQALVNRVMALSETLRRHLDSRVHPVTLRG